MIIEFKKMIKKDLPFYLEVKNDPITRKYIGDNDIITMEEAEVFLKNLPMLYYIILIDKIPVGILKRFIIREPYARYAIDIHPDHRRKGYARAAYKKIYKQSDKKKEVCLVRCFDDNLALPLHLELGHVICEGGNKTVFVKDENGIIQPRNYIKLRRVPK